MGVQVGLFQSCLLRVGVLFSGSALAWARAGELACGRACDLRNVRVTNHGRTDGVRVHTSPVSALFLVANGASDHDVVRLCLLLLILCIVLEAADSAEGHQLRAAAGMATISPTTLRSSSPGLYTVVARIRAIR